MKRIFLQIWQLPQHLLSLIIYIFIKNRIKSKTTYKHSTVYRVEQSGWGVSLGNYIFLDIRYPEQTVLHEYGHSRQSLFLGPLYLFVVGLPSITMNILTRLHILRSENYYKRWPENWADKLGGVERIV